MNNKNNNYTIIPMFVLVFFVVVLRHLVCKRNINTDDFVFFFELKIQF